MIFFQGGLLPVFPAHYHFRQLTFCTTTGKTNEKWATIVDLVGEQELQEEPGEDHHNHHGLRGSSFEISARTYVTTRVPRHSALHTVVKTRNTLVKFENHGKSQKIQRSRALQCWQQKKAIKGNKGEQNETKETDTFWILSALFFMITKKMGNW